MKKNYYKTFAIVAYIFSGICTWIFLVQAAQTLVDKLILTFLAILFEPVKALTFTRIFGVKTKSTFVFAGTIVLWIVLEIASISASTAYMINNQNKIDNNTYKNSIAYKDTEDKKTRLNEQIKTIQKDIVNLKAEKEATINRMTQDKDNLPANYLTAKQQAQYAINDKAKEYQDIIDAKQSEITRLNQELNSTTLPDKVEAKAENGYTGFFNAVAECLNSLQGKDANPISATTLSLVFYFVVVGVVPELIGNIFWYYYKAEPYENTKVQGIRKFKIKPDGQDRRVHSPASTKNRMVEFFESFGAPKFKGKIGFKNDYNEDKNDSKPVVNNDVGFSDDDVLIQQYFDYILASDKYKKLGLSPGIESISKNTGIPLETARMIKKHLERKGLLKVIDKNTHVCDGVHSVHNCSAKD